MGMGMSVGSVGGLAVPGQVGEPAALPSAAALVLCTAGARVRGGGRASAPEQDLPISLNTVGFDIVAASPAQVRRIRRILATL